MKAHASNTHRIAGLAARILAFMALVLAVGLAAAQTPATPATKATPTTELKVAPASGNVAEHITDAEGRSVYLFTNDTSKMSNCTDQCATTWPPVMASSATAMPKVGTGLESSMLGTIERADGTYQLTYNGWPLYYYSRDTKAGDTTGQGVNDNWYLVTPKGTGVGVDATKPGGGAPGSTM